MKYKINILLLTMIFQISTLLNAQVFTKTRKYEESYKVSPETSLQINNKYGNIHLVPWEKDSVRLEINMKFTANKESKVEKLYSYIDAEITNNRYYIIANTVFKNYKGTFWSDVTDMANTIFSGGNNVQINYLVYLPKNINLKIENKFGNVYTTDLSGEVEINISNGDLKAHDFTGKTKIDLQFSNVVINKIISGNININYSELELEQSSNLIINSRSSTLNLDHNNILIIDSRRDKYNLMDVNSLNLKTSFTYFNANTLKMELSAQTKYGSLDIRSVNLGFKNINIELDYTDVKISFPRGSSYRLDLTYSKTELIYPEQLAVLEKTTINIKEEIYRLNGIVGKSSNPSSKIKINAKSGKINLFHK